MEFTEIDELNDMIVFSKSYRSSLIPKFSKFFDLDFKTPSDLNYISLENLIENSYEDLPSPSQNPAHKAVPTIRVKPIESEKQNETIEEILNDISSSMVNFELNISAIASPLKKKSEESSLFSPIKEAEHKKEESEAELIEEKENSPEKKPTHEEDKNEEENKGQNNSLDDKKNFAKREDGDVSQTFTEKRKLTSCLTENIRLSKGPVNFFIKLINYVS